MDGPALGADGRAGTNCCQSVNRVCSVFCHRPGAVSSVISGTVTGAPVTGRDKPDCVPRVTASDARRKHGWRPRHCSVRWTCPVLIVASRLRTQRIGDRAKCAPRQRSVIVSSHLCLSPMSHLRGHRAICPTIPACKPQPSRPSFGHLARYLQAKLIYRNRMMR